MKSEPAHTHCGFRRRVRVLLNVGTTVGLTVAALPVVPLSAKHDCAVVGDIREPPDSSQLLSSSLEDP